MKDDFFRRYLRICKSIEEQAQMTFAAAKHRERELEMSVSAMLEAQRDASARFAEESVRGLYGADWQGWQAYLTWLQQRLQEQCEAYQAAGERVAVCHEQALEAHRQAKMWERLVEQRTRRAWTDQLRRTQRQLDEDAVVRAMRRAGDV